MKKIKKKKEFSIERTEGDSLLKVVNDIGDFRDVRFLATDLKIGDIDRSAITLPSILAWWGVMESISKRKADQADEMFKVERARISKQIRRKAAKNNIKMTESQINDEVLTSPEYIEAIKNKTKAFYDSSLMRTAVRSLEVKKDMLWILSNNKRAEITSGISMSDFNKILNKSAGRRLNKANKKEEEE